jgi:glucose-1-phosphate adenylyltransferase
MKSSDVIAVVLGGGVGKRLYPLTKMRSKPAVPVGGKYRLVDIPISNCINSGIDKIMVLTQFNSVSLHRHITSTFKFDSFSKGWVQILAAEQTPTSSDWYMGTADAVRKQLNEIKSANPKDVLILSGDHLYRIDYRNFIKSHRDARADITLAVLPVSEKDASRFGILVTDEDQRVVSFHEKPKDPTKLAMLRSYDDPEKPYLGSMGVYVFKADVLVELLEKHQESDFGSDIIPVAIGSKYIHSFPFSDYWEDIGTIRSYYEANLALAKQNPNFNFYDPERPIYTQPLFLPSSVTHGECKIEQSMLADGCYIETSNIRGSVVGIRSVIGPSATVINSIIMGADYYETKGDQERSEARGIPRIGIGEGSVIEGAIVDKNARIGANVRIHYNPERAEMDSENYAVRDGIVIVPKNAVIASGTVI